MFKCPITGAAVATGHTAESVQRDTPSGTFVCPACGLTHTWYRNEVWLLGDERAP